MSTNEVMVSNEVEAYMTDKVNIYLSSITGALVVLSVLLTLMMVATVQPYINVSDLNRQRSERGLPELITYCLPEIASRVYDNCLFYLEDPVASIPQFHRVVCGGTFDRFHNGHRKLLTLAAGCCGPGGTLTVGVTDNAMSTKKVLLI